MPDSDTDASWAVELRRAFSRYDADVSRIIEGAYMRQEPSVSITVRSHPYIIMFADMKQISSTDSTKTRRVQRSAPPTNKRKHGAGENAAPDAPASGASSSWMGCAPAPAAAPPLRFKRWRENGFVASSTLCTSPAAVPRLLPPPTLQVEVLHASPGKNVILIRKALAAASQLVVAQLLTTAAQHLEQVRASGKGAIWVDESGAATTLLHGETRMALRASAVQLRGSGHAAAADEVAALADEREYTSTGGALVYPPGERLGLHLDDIAACNSSPFDPRVVLWSFGNDVDFQWAPARFKGRPMLDGRRHNATYELQPGVAVRTVKLQHGDALLLNVERIVHGVARVSDTCADAAATKLLPGRRMCVPIRPKADPHVEAEHYRLRAGAPARRSTK